MLEDPGCCQPDLPKWEGRGSELFLESKNQECSTEEKKGRRCKTVHSYYQWVAYILVFQVFFRIMVMIMMIMTRRMLAVI